MRIASTAQPSAAETATLFVALELSKSTWLSALHSPIADKVSQHSIEGGDAIALLARITRKRTEAEAKLGRPVRVVCCYEAGYDGFWLHRFLLANGIESRVLDAASILVDRRARRAKTDRLDVVSLLRTLMSHERGEPRVCRVVRVPSVEEEDRRRLTRERERLVVERGAHINRIKGLLMLHGVRNFAPVSKHWQDELAALAMPDGGRVPKQLAREIARECRRLHLVLAMIGEVDAEIEREASIEPGETSIRLQRLRGLGPVFSGVLAQEVFFRDFANRRQVGHYIGLCASPWQSGGLHRDQGISKAGNPRARRMAIECAWLWLRHQPGSALTRWFEARVGRMRGRVRRIAIVALARKLMVALWRYLCFGLVPEGAVLKG